MKTLFRLSALIAPLLPLMALAVAFGTAGIMCAIGIPVLGVAFSTDGGPLPALVVLGVCRGALHYAEQYCNHYIAFTILARIRGIVFKKLRSLGPSKLEGRQKGGLIALVTSDIELLEVFYAHTVSPVCIAVLASAGVCAFLAQKNVLLVVPAALSYAAADVADGADVPFSGADCTDVRFRYGRSEEYVLDGVSLAVPAGTIVGISGKSGSGKSTLLRLFMRFWDASSGSVRISGTDVKKINTACLRGIESYVTQETVLFHDTIENNIRIAKLDATEDEIREACRKASIIKLIERLPDGFKTQVAELGDNFSGGERQRIGLARSFLHDGGFLPPAPP